MKLDLKKVKPFIKIAGGKYSLLPIIVDNLPKSFNKVETYVEPFLGGGSVFLHMAANSPKIKNFYINELNSDIHLIWDSVFSNWNNLEYQKDFNYYLTFYKKGHHEDTTFYYQLRDKFNSNEVLSKTERTAMFYYLNKTCFNGLIRYNASGKFNSPKGDYKNPPIDDTKAMAEVSNLINNRAELTKGDFQVSIEQLLKQKKINKKTFVYLDPPYIPQSPTSNFTSYSPSNFTEYDQRRLACTLFLLDRVGAKFMLSNSDTPLTREIFGHFNLINVMNIRNISCKKDTRGKTSELLITNYE